MTNNYRKFDQLVQELDLQFNDAETLLNAFVHRSYLNENRAFHLPSNERLEFLGDACLELITSEYLYQEYPHEPEGVLTNYRSALVNTTSLAQSARALKLGKYLLLSHGEESNGGRDSEYLLANTFEALLGAIYLDQGYPNAQKIAVRYVLHKLPEIIDKQIHRDPKSRLQELSQAHFSITPEYKILNEWGPDHNKNFEVKVVINDQLQGTGTGSSKQRAEIAAAQNVLEKWNF